MAKYDIDIRSFVKPKEQTRASVANTCTIQDMQQVDTAIYMTRPLIRWVHSSVEFFW